MRVCARCGRPIALPGNGLRSAKEIRQDRLRGDAHAIHRAAIRRQFCRGILCRKRRGTSAGARLSSVRRIVEKSPLLLREARVTSHRIEFPATGATIVAIASDYAGSAGANPTISCFDELWGYHERAQPALVGRNGAVPARKISCRFTTTYAGFSGESTLLEELHNRGRALPTIGPDLHAGDGLLMFWTHDPVAPWQDEKWLAQMRRTLRPNQYLRMIENRFVSTESPFIEMRWFDACVDPNARALVSEPNLPVYIGIDASTKHDSTAIVVVAWDKKASKARLIWHRIYQPSPDEPLELRNNHRAHTDGSEAALSNPKGRRSIRGKCRRFRSAYIANGIHVEEFPQSSPDA